MPKSSDKEPLSIEELAHLFMNNGYYGTTVQNQEFVAELLRKMSSLEQRIAELEGSQRGK